jgi:hypothetical protein
LNAQQSAEVRLTQLENDNFKLRSELEEMKKNQESVMALYRANEHQEMINKINTFYDSSWNKMMWVIGTFVAIIGVVIPLAIQWMQQRNFQKISDKLLKDATNSYELKIEEFKNENEISKSKEAVEFEKKINTLSENNRQELEVINNVFADNIREIDEKYEDYIVKVEANFFSLSADDYFENDKFIMASQFYFISAYLCTKIEESEKQSFNLSRFLNKLIISFEKISSEDKVKICDFTFRDTKLNDVLYFLRSKNLNLHLVEKLESLIAVE